jgi:hypothetical protein
MAPSLAHALELPGKMRLDKEIAHAIYWLVTHPINQVWTTDLQLSGLGATFFSMFAVDISGDWSRLRDVWEHFLTSPDRFSPCWASCSCCRRQLA